MDDGNVVAAATATVTELFFKHTVVFVALAISEVVLVSEWRCMTVKKFC